MRKPNLNKGQAFLFADRINRRYLCKADVAEGFLLFCDKPAYFTDMRYFCALRDKLVGSEVKPCVYNGLSDIKTAIDERGIKTLFIDFTRVTLSEYQRYKELCGDIRDAAEIMTDLRAVKDEEEIAAIRSACEIVQSAVKAAFDNVYEGVTETEVKKFLEARMEDMGGDGAAFDTIVAFGENSAVPHHETGKRRLKKGDAVLIDAGCKVNGYCSDITRTAFFGQPDQEFLRAYAAVLAANEKAEREIVAGISGKAADNIAREELSRVEFGENFTHSLGHGVGLEIHEMPRLSSGSGDILAENEVFTVEPGVYLDGKFGIRIEDTCVMRGGRAERLFTDDKSLLILNGKK